MAYLDELAGGLSGVNGGGIGDRFAGGLRSAAGVLNPDIQKQNAEEERQAIRMMQVRKNMIAQQVIRGAENGSIAKDQAEAALERLGIRGVPFGPSLDAQKTQEQLTKDRRAQDVTQAAGDQFLTGEKPDLPGYYTALARDSSTMKEGVTGLEKQQEREVKYREISANREAKIQEVKDRLAQTLQIANDNRASRDQIAEMVANGRAEVARINGESRNAMIELRREIASQGKQPKAGEYALPNGSRVTHAQIMSQYKQDNKLMDDLDLQILSKTDPARAAVEREKISKAQPFDQYAKQRFGIDVYGGAAGAGAPTPAATGASGATGAQQARKTLNGKNYVKINGKWFEE